MSGLVYRINMKTETPNERGIPKSPVVTAIIRHSGIEGDYNRYRSEKFNADSDKAIMFIPSDTLDQLSLEGWPVVAGDLGENITVKGIPYEAFAINQKYAIGDDALIQIAKPCHPCSGLKVLPYVGQEKLKSFMQTLLNRRGWYARVLKEGRITVQDR